MKKVLMLLLTLALVLSMAGVVTAGNVETQNAQSGESGITTITYGVTEGFKLKIPVAFSFKVDDTTMDTSVSVESVSLTTNNVLNVTVTSHHGWKLVEHKLGANDQQEEVTNGAKLEYTMQVNSGEIYGDSEDDETSHVQLLLVNPGVSSAQANLKFTLVDVTSAKAASYQDKLYFSAHIQPSAVALEDGE